MDPNPAGAPTGSACPADRSAASSAAISTAQPTVCEPYREAILAKLDQSLTAQRIWQDFVSEHGFAAKYHSVRRFVPKLGQAFPPPFRRMECESGVEVQVDFGPGGADRRGGRQAKAAASLPDRPEPIAEAANRWDARQAVTHSEN